MVAQVDSEPPQVTCPQCGGENSLRSGESFFACAFCGTTLFLDRSAIVAHYRLPRLVDRKQAQAALRRWMAGNDTVKDLDRKSKISAIDAVTFPMWLFRWRKGKRESVTVEPAAPTPMPVLADLSIPAGKLDPYDGAEEGAEAVPVAIPLETARGWVEQRGVTADEVTEVALVEIPLWRASYEYSGETFFSIVEGSTGRVLASVFPEKAESPYILVAVLGLILFGIEGLIITNPFLKLVAYALTGVPLLFLAWLVTRKV
ncbi:MAG: hypothetical protein GY769_09490 [bacterium]|nr:hypothetical protein [bacterium]